MFYSLSFLISSRACTHFSDLSNNEIAAISKRMFKGVTSLRSLQLDHNQIVCIDELALKSLHELEILTLNNNNITTMPRDMFSNMPRLRALRLSDNPFACDCHLSWLSKFLRSATRLAPYTRCHSPSQLKGQNVADLHDQEFKCSGMFRSYTVFLNCGWMMLNSMQHIPQFISICGAFHA